MRLIDNNSVKIFANKNVNINEYYKTFDENSDQVKNMQKNAKFIRYCWLDITNLDLHDEILSNVAVRANQGLSDNIDSIMVSYGNIGWDCSQFPPIVGTDGVPRDGRTRIRAAIKLGEKFIPCAVYSYENNKSVRQNSTNGILANRKLPYEKVKWEDFVSTGVAIIKANEMKCEMADIEDWLYNEADVQYSYTNVGGAITKIAKQIFDRASKGGDLLILRSRDEWLQWLEQSIQKYTLHYQNSYGVKTIEDIAFYESGGSRADHILCKYILPNASKGIITNIVIYSSNDDTEKTKANHLEFDRQLKLYYSQIYGLVNRDLSESGIKLAKPRDAKYWRIIGAIPQLRTEEQAKLLHHNVLASIDDFKFKSSLSIALGIDDEFDEAA